MTDEPQLDAVDLLRRIEALEPHLVARVVAEARLEQVEKRLNGAESDEK